ncbi:MAG: O-antigen ligase family protein [Oscillospiraceae bacterium]|jgi:O-antigen ligase|nr:O-antigen ligase family protein [Oscillospiraceae bacterium]
MNKYFKNVTFFEWVYAIVITAFSFFPLLIANAQHKKYEWDAIIATYDYDFFFGWIAVIAVALQFFGTVLDRKFSLKTYWQTRRPTCLFAIFYILAVFSTILQVMRGTTLTGKELFFGTDLRLEGLFTYLVYILLFYMATQIKTPILKRLILYIFLAVGLYVCIMSFAGSFKEEYVAGIGFDVGTFLNPNHYGYYLAVLFGCVFALIISDKLSDNKIEISPKLSVNPDNIMAKSIYFLFFILIVYVLTLADALGAYIACAAIVLFGVFALFARKGNIKKGLLAVLALIVCGCLVLVAAMQISTRVDLTITQLFKDIEMVLTKAPGAETAGTGRWVLWTETWDKILEKPFFGWGVEGITDYLGEKIGTVRTHNEYLQYWAFFGTFAIIAYLWGIISVYTNAYKNRKAITGIEIACLCGALGYAVNAFVGVSLLYSAPYFFILLGLSNISSPKK